MAHFITRPDPHFNVVPGLDYACVRMTDEELKTIPFHVPCTYIVEDLRFDGTAYILNKETRDVGFSVSYVSPPGKFGERPSRKLHLNLSHSSKEHTMAHFIQRPVRDIARPHVICNAIVQYAPREKPYNTLGLEAIIEVEDLRLTCTPVSESEDGTTVTYSVRDMWTVDSTDAAQPACASEPDIMRFFEYAHLPNHLQEISRPLHGIAQHMVRTLESSAELSAGLRKLLEAKDCFVRAALPPKKGN